MKRDFPPSRNTTLCPDLGPHGHFAEPSVNFMSVFRKILVPNLIEDYYLVKFSALRASFSITKSCRPVYVMLVNIIKRNLVRRTSGIAQTSFGNGFIAKSSTIFFCQSFPLHRKTPSHLVFVVLSCARNSPFSKNILALFPCCGDPKCPTPPC